MSNMRPHGAVCLLLTLAVNYASCKPTLILYSVNKTEIIHNSNCTDANRLVNDLDQFIVKGQVKREKSDSNVYKDTNLYLQAVRDPSTNAWASQCRPDLTVCDKENHQEDCYCESKDNDGYYHLVMKIMAKSIYSDGKLMLSWNDARSPYNPPVTSKPVDYYNGSIINNEYATLNITWANGTSQEQSLTETFVTYPSTSNITKVTFCVYNLEMNRSIEIKEEDHVLVNTTIDECVTVNISEEKKLKMSFMELEGCKRGGEYIFTLSAGDDTTGDDITGDEKTGDETSGQDGNGTTLPDGAIIAIGVVGGCGAGFFLVVICIWRRKKDTSENAQTCICCCCILFPTCKCRKKKKTSKYDPNPITGTNQYEDIDYTYTEKTELSADGQNSLYANKNVIPNEVSSKDNKGVNPNDNKVVSIDFRQTITNADKVPDAYAYPNKKHCTTINVA